MACFAYFVLFLMNDLVSNYLWSPVCRLLTKVTNSFFFFLNICVMLKFLDRPIRFSFPHHRYRVIQYVLLQKCVDWMNVSIKKVLKLLNREAVKAAEKFKRLREAKERAWRLWMVKKKSQVVGPIELFQHGNMGTAVFPRGFHCTL